LLDSPYLFFHQGTTNDDLYWSERNSPSEFAYNIPVLEERTMYKITLHMAELYHNETGGRVFDVFIEGDSVLADLDLVEDIGAAFTAKEYVFTKEVSDGVLDILFVTKVDQAKVNGIEVILG